MQKINSVKGMKDLFGEELNKHQYLSQIFRKLCVFYNYEEIATPLVEHIQIFNRSLGETSDIVSKEMYNFTDQYFTKRHS